jgi:hypothetical protein
MMVPPVLWVLWYTVEFHELRGVALFRWVGFMAWAILLITSAEWADSLRSLSL